MYKKNSWWTKNIHTHLSKKSKWHNIDIHIHQFTSLTRVVDFTKRVIFFSTKGATIIYCR